jgi:hypothetical protein
MKMNLRHEPPLGVCRNFSEVGPASDISKWYAKIFKVSGQREKIEKLFYLGIRIGCKALIFSQQAVCGCFRIEE